MVIHNKIYNIYTTYKYEKKITYIIKIKNISPINVKSHDILNVHFYKNYNIVELETGDIKSFFENNNDENITIIYYCQTLDKINYYLLEKINKLSVVKSKIIIFSFDYWLGHGKSDDDYLKI